MTRVVRISIVLITLTSCLLLQRQALAQSCPTFTLPTIPPLVGVVASTRHDVIDDVGIVGLQAVSESDVKLAFYLQCAGLLKGAVLEFANVKKGEEIIKHVLARSGYMNSIVEVRFEETSPGSMRITYVVEEGPPAVIREIKFDGNQVFTHDELSSQLRFLTVMSHDVYDEARLSSDLFDVRTFMRSRGYLQARVLEPKLHSLNGNLTVIVPIEEGPRYFVGEITVICAKRLTPEQIIEHIGVKKGEIADEGRLSVAINQELYRLYGNLGFPKHSSEVDWKYRVNPDNDKVGVVDFEVTIDEGTYYKIGSVEFRGTSKLTNQELRQFLLFKEGDTYMQQRIYDSFEALRKSGLVQPFGLEAAAAYKFDEETGTVEIIIKVQEL